MKSGMIAIAGILLASSALACDDHFGKCDLEAWRYTHTPFMQAMTIEGSTTCDTGSATIRLFSSDSGSEEFIGVAQGLIEGHALQATALGIHKKPEDLSIKYSIEPRE